MIAFTLVALLSVGAAASFLAGTRVRRMTGVMRVKRSALVSNIEEKVNALPVVQVFGRSRGERARLARQNDSLTASLVSLASARARLRLISAGASSLAAAAALAAGAFEVAAGRVSIGAVVAATSAARHLSGPVRRLGLWHEYWQRGRVSRAKIVDFLIIPGRAQDPPGLPALRVRKGRIEFDGVSVRGSLDGFSAVATPGRVVAVVGPSGAGKSTLLWSVARLVEPDAGRVIVDGQVLADHTRASTFRQVGDRKSVV